MKLYSELPAVRTRQVLRDLGVLVWVVVWIAIGRRVFELVDRLGAPGRTLAGAGRDLSSRLNAARAEVSELPVVGGTLDGVFEDLAQTGGALVRAGNAQQDTVGSLALWLGVLLALLPILYVLGRYLPERMRWMRAASTASELRAGSHGLELFAWRALANRPLSELIAVSPDPMGDFEAGNYEALARLELQALDLGPPP